MKLPHKFKLIFMISVIALYFSGVAFYILDRFFKVQGSFGPENNPWQLSVLHLHAIFGLLFFFLFGYVYRVHVEPGLRGKRRKPSGYVFLTVIVILCLSVPGLYYLNDENLKDKVAWIHTYLGLVTILPFLIHIYIKDRVSRKRKGRE